jgi:hypothetical protein
VAKTNRKCEKKMITFAYGNNCSDRDGLPSSPTTPDATGSVTGAETPVSAMTAVRKLKSSNQQMTGIRLRSH